MPLEAQSAGKPVIALGRAGALDTVIPLNRRHSFLTGGSAEPTGVFFYEYRPDALEAAVRYFEENEDAFDPDELRRHAHGFDREIYKQRMKRFVDDTLASKDDESTQREKRLRQVQKWAPRVG